MKILKQIGIFLLTVFAFGIGLWKYTELIGMRKLSQVYDSADFSVPAFWVLIGLSCVIWLWTEKGKWR